MVDGAWETKGQMNATMNYMTSAGKMAQNDVILQPTVVQINAGGAYSSIVKTQYPIDMLKSVTIHWRSYAIDGLFVIRDIFVQGVMIEPLYLLEEEQDANTKAFCHPKEPFVEIHSESSATFNSEC